jgi:uncharacterized protein YbjT (DUF2867 family)
MGASAGSMFFYNQIKGRTEEDVKALGLRSLIIFRPALLVGPRLEFRLPERIATNTLVPLSRLLPTRTRKRLITEVESLAARMLAEGKAAARGVHLIQAKDIEGLPKPSLARNFLFGGAGDVSSACDVQNDGLTKQRTLQISS